MNVEIRKLYGITDSDGKIIIPYIYDEIYKYYNEKTNDIKYEVIKNSKSGLFDKNGKEIIPCEYDDICAYKYFSSAKKNDKWGILEANEKIDCKYDSIEEYEDFAITKQTVDSIPKYEIINAVDFIPYSWLVFDTIITLGNFLIAQYNKEWKILSSCYINSEENEHHGESLKSFLSIHLMDDNHLRCQVINDKYVIVTKNIEKENKYGRIYDDSTKMMSYEEYDYAEMLTSSIVCVTKNKICGLVDDFGRVTPMQYSEFESFDICISAKLYNEEKYHLYNNDLGRVTTMKFDKIDVCGEKIKVKIKEKYGIYETNGAEIIPIILA